MALPKCIKTGSPEDREWRDLQAEILELKLALLGERFRWHQSYRGASYECEQRNRKECASLQDGISTRKARQQEIVDSQLVLDEDYLFELAEKHITNPALPLAYGPLLKAALEERLAAYREEMRIRLLASRKPAVPAQVPVAVPVADSIGHLAILARARFERLSSQPSQREHFDPVAIAPGAAAGGGK